MLMMPSLPLMDLESSPHLVMAQLRYGYCLSSDGHEKHAVFFSI